MLSSPLTSGWEAASPHAASPKCCLACFCCSRSRSHSFLSFLFHLTISLLALLCFDLLQFPYFFSSPTMFSRSATVITFSVCLTISPPLTSTSLSLSHASFAFFPSPVLFFLFTRTHQCVQTPPSQSCLFFPLLPILLLLYCCIPCSSRISYFQSQIAVAGMPNRTRDTRRSAFTSCRLTSNKKGKI